jgi:hypothetical protein
MYSLMTNLPTNPPNLHTPSYSKKSKTYIGDRKKQLEFEQMLCKNVVWWKVDDAFQELSERKPLFIGGIVEMLKIWHLLQCDLVDWDWRVEKKRNLQKSWVPLCAIRTLALLSSMHMASSCETTNKYIFTLFHIVSSSFVNIKCTYVQIPFFSIVLGLRFQNVSKFTCSCFNKCLAFK